MKGCRLICIGKLKTSFWKEACEHYVKLLRKYRAVEISELRDSAPELDPEARIREEGSRILKSLKAGDFAIALTEAGELRTSKELASFLRNCDEREQMRPTFIIGGPYGLAQEVLDRAKACLSLSLMTFPHELCRVLLLEQIFRSESILHNSPYHH